MNGLLSPPNRIIKMLSNPIFGVGTKHFEFSKIVLIYELINFLNITFEYFQLQVELDVNIFMLQFQCVKSHKLLVQCTPAKDLNGKRGTVSKIS